MFVSKKKYLQALELVEFYKSLNVQQNATLDREFGLNGTLRKALQEILAQETAAPNATVTRILNIARKAIGL